MVQLRTGTGLRRIRQLIGPRRAAIAVLVGLGLLLVDNVYWLVRNQARLPCREKVCVSSRSIEKVWRDQSRPVTVALANAYFLKQRISPARLAISSRMAKEKWNLENVAQLRVEVSDGPLIVDRRTIRRLRRSSTERRSILWRRSKGRIIASDLYLHFDPAARDYVLAETDDSAGPLFVLPRSEYSRVEAR